MSSFVKLRFVKLHCSAVWLTVELSYLLTHLTPSMLAAGFTLTDILPECEM